MKRILIVSILLLFSLLLFGCGTDTDSDPDVEGYVLKTDENRVLVAEDITAEEFEDIKDKTVSEFREHNTSQEDKIAELMYIDYDDASKFEKGDKVDAWIGDIVLDSYPGQAEGEEISLASGDSSQEVEGYILEIDDDEILLLEDDTLEEFEKVEDKFVSDDPSSNFEGTNPTFDGPDDADLMYIDYKDADVEIAEYEKGDEIKAQIGESIRESYPAQTDGKQIYLKD